MASPRAVTGANTQVPAAPAPSTSTAWVASSRPCELPTSGTRSAGSSPCVRVAAGLPECPSRMSAGSLVHRRSLRVRRVAAGALNRPRAPSSAAKGGRLGGALTGGSGGGGGGGSNPPPAGRKAGRLSGALTGVSGGGSVEASNRPPTSRTPCEPAGRRSPLTDATADGTDAFGRRVTFRSSEQKEQRHESQRQGSPCHHAGSRGAGGGLGHLHGGAAHQRQGIVSRSDHRARAVRSSHGRREHDRRERRLQRGGTDRRDPQPGRRSRQRRPRRSRLRRRNDAPRQHGPAAPSLA